MKKAFTLIEVLLALMLMCVVLMIVGFAIDTNLRLLDSSRTEVEEAQLARALLEKISRDIRSVVITQPTDNLQVDTSMFDSVFGGAIGLDSSDPSALLNAAGGSSSSATGSADSSSTSSRSTSSETSTTDPSAVPESGTVAGTTPGIYGSVDWLQVDTGRLPRGETFKASWVLAEGSQLGDHISPTKTSLYYLGKDTGTLSRDESTEERIGGSLGTSMDRYAYQYGLYRRQLDRNVTEFAVENELEEQYEALDEPLAPEVEGIEFHYYDTANEEWIDYWDMDEFGALPGAVRVILHIRTHKTQPSAFYNPFGSSASTIDTLTYSTVVPMPLSYEAPKQEDNSTQAESTSGSGTNTTTGSSSTSGTQTQ